MKKEEVIPNYFKCASGSTIRIFEGPWFCLSDVLGLSGAKIQQNVLNKLSMQETKRMVCDGKSRRFVNPAGLLAIAPQKGEHAQIRTELAAALKQYLRHE